MGFWRDGDVMAPLAFSVFLYLFYPSPFLSRMQMHPLLAWDQMFLQTSFVVSASTLDSIVSDCLRSLPLFCNTSWGGVKEEADCMERFKHISGCAQHSFSELGRGEILWPGIRKDPSASTSAFCPHVPHTHLKHTLNRLRKT